MERVITLRTDLEHDDITAYAPGFVVEAPLAQLFAGSARHDLDECVSWRCLASCDDIHKIYAAQLRLPVRWRLLVWEVNHGVVRQEHHNHVAGRAEYLAVEKFTKN